MGKATILYTSKTGAQGLVIYDRITHIEGTETSKDCQIHLDTGEIIETREDLYELRSRAEVAYSLRGAKSRE